MGFELAVGLRAAPGLGAGVGLRATAVFRLTLGFSAGLGTGFTTGFGAARGTALDFERRGLGRAFASAIFFGEASGLRARRFKAACADLALFLACLAIFLPTFANFRARFSTCLAARSACFNALARVAALFASTLNRCAEAACRACVADEEVATAISFLQDGFGA
jgi:hypothetical protein